MWLHWTVVGLLQQASPALKDELDYREEPSADLLAD